jgi:hypothetical protein
MSLKLGLLPIIDMIIWKPDLGGIITAQPCWKQAAHRGELRNRWDCATRYLNIVRVSQYILIVLGGLQCPQWHGKRAGTLTVADNMQRCFNCELGGTNVSGFHWRYTLKSVDWNLKISSERSRPKCQNGVVVTRVFQMSKAHGDLGFAEPSRRRFES